MQAITQIDPLQFIIDELRAMLPEMACMGEKLEHLDRLDYFRVCSPNERVVDLLEEANTHGSILAFKGEVTCILPNLPEGWARHGSAAA